MAKGRDWNDLHRENPGAIRAINDDPAEDIPFDVCDPDYEPSGEPWPNGKRKPKMEIEWFNEAADSALNTPANPLIEDLLDEGALSVIYGDSGSGKTFCALDIGFHVAAGLDWNGKRVRRGLVVYVAAEGGKRIKRRIAALKKRYLGEPEPLFALVRYQIDLRSSDADLNTLLALVRDAEKETGERCLWLIVGQAATRTRPLTWAASLRRPIGSGQRPAPTSPMFIIPAKTRRAALAAILC